jgi:hypothetical protein
MATRKRLFRRNKLRNPAKNANQGRNLILALCVKFCLVGILWWTVFAGKRAPVAAGQTAHALLDTPAAHLQEAPR